MAGLFGKPNVKKMKEEKDIKGLKKALEYNKDKNIQLNAVTALKEMGEKNILVDGLKNEDYSIRDYIADALIEIGDVNLILNAIASDEYTIRSKAIDILPKIVDEKDVSVLFNALKHSNYFVRAHVAKVLGNMENEQSIKPLLLALLVETEDYALEIIDEALNKFNDDAINSYIESDIVNSPEATLEHLKSMFDTYKSLHDVSIRLGAAICKKLGEPAIKVLINNMANDIEKRLDDENGWRSDNMVRILGKVGEMAVPHLTAVIGKTSHAHRALGRIGTQDAINILKLELKSYDWMRVETAVYALSATRDKSVFQAIKSLSNTTTNYEVQRACDKVVEFLADKI